jgi:outer membrane receptor protein involved in Fe transport
LNLSLLNIFDIAYYEHLNRKYVNMRLTGVLYEPGRNFIAMLKLYY